MFLFAAVVAICFFAICRASWILFWNLPSLPGPICLPLLGDIGFLLTRKPLPHYLTHLSKKYGDIYGVALGSRFVVVLSSKAAILSALSNKAVQGRPTDSYLIDCLIQAGEIGCTFAEGESWRAGRKTIVKVLAPFVCQRAHSPSPHYPDYLDQCLKPQLRWLLATLLRSSTVFNLKVRKSHLHDELDSKVKMGNNRWVPIDTPAVFTSFTSSFMFSLITGSPCNPADEFFQQISGLSRSDCKEKMKNADYFPLLTPFYLREIRSVYAGMKTLVQNFFVKIGQTSPFTIPCFADFDGNVQDFGPNCEKLDPASTRLSIRDQLEKTCKTDMSNSVHRHGSDNLLIDIFDAGYATSSEVLVWGCLFLAENPSVQAKMLVELQTVLDSDQIPQISFLPNLHYCKAVFFEVLRLSSATGLGLSHRAMENVSVGGHVIPDNTIVIPNFHAIHHDEKTFKHPDDFYPERFLKTGAFDRSLVANVLSFSVGKRKCPGERIATQVLPIVLAAIIQNFELSLHLMDPEPRKNVRLTLTVSPGPHRVVFRPRM